MNQKNNSHQRNRLDVPPRRKIHSAAQNSPVEQAGLEPHYSKSELAKMRKNFGFDNIPVEEDENLDNVRLRDIIRAWILQATGRKEKPADQKASRLRAIKNDIKWALQADLDEPVKPYVKPPASTSHVAENVKPAATAHNQTSAKPDAGKSIDININFGSLPSFASIKNYLQKIFRLTVQHKRISAGMVAVVIVGGVSIYTLTNFLGESNLQKETISSTKPEFDTLLPNGKSINNLGGWKRVSPPGTAPAFAYSDKIDNVTIAVSQQALPDNFKNNTSRQMTELAKNFNATEKLTTTNGTDIYIGASAQGPQSVILTIDHLLILIKSTGKIDDKKWASYVDSLISPVQKF